MITLTALVTWGYHAGSIRQLRRPNSEAEYFKSAAGTVHLFIPGDRGRRLLIDDRFYQLVIKSLSFTRPIKTNDVYMSPLILGVEDKNGMQEIELPFQFMVDGEGVLTDCVAVT